MKKFDEINIIPFIDIMLVLLAIVLVTASFISQGKIKVNVPKASSTVAFKSDELTKLLTVTADKQLYFNDKPIYAEASFQDFVTITDMLSKNEIKNVVIVSMKDKGAPSKTTQGNESKNTPEVGGVASGGVGVGRSQ